MIPIKPTKIVCVGRNYAAHAREMGNDVPTVPMLFLKPPSALIGPGDAIRLPSACSQVEFEAEIGIVVGKRLSRSNEEGAERAIGGVICVNDVTCRDLQKRDGQWGRAKGFDTFCPVGPRPTAGLDWRSLEIIGRVNGAERQRARSSDMVFSIPALMAFISGIMTLEPGDLIATGTPAGTGPLADGDLVEVEIPGVGMLANPVRHEDR